MEVKGRGRCGRYRLSAAISLEQEKMGTTDVVVAKTFDSSTEALCHRGIRIWIYDQDPNLRHILGQWLG